MERTLTFGDFMLHERGADSYYSAIVGGYEVILIRQSRLCWTVGLYKAGTMRYALRMQPVYFRNHPTEKTSEGMETSLRQSAVNVANSFLNEQFNNVGPYALSAAK